MKTKNMQENLKKDFQIRNWIENTPKGKPYVDTAIGMVYWGTSEEKRKEKKGT